MGSLCWIVGLLVVTGAAGEVGGGIHAQFRAEYLPVAHEVVEVIRREGPEFGPLLVRLAWHTVANYNRAMSPRGGSNGGCMRHEPERSDPENKKLDEVREKLEPLKKPFMSYADLYILAGNTALEHMGAPALYFAPGREDFPAREASQRCVPHGRMPRKHEGGDAFPHRDTQNYLIQKFGELGISGVTDPEAFEKMVALMGGHTLGGMHREVSGNEGDWTTTPFVFNNEYFRALVDFEWTQRSGDHSLDVQYEEQGQGGGKLVMLPIDVALKFHPQLFEVVQRFAADESLFRKYFAEGWKHITQLGVTSGGGVLHEAWEGSSGELITSGGLERMESQLGRDGYRERLRGYLHPPVGGTYHLWVSGDDECKLFVEGTEVARVPGWTLKGEWGKYAEQRSGPLQLEAGKKYYVEVLHEEWAGDDHVAVAWAYGDSTTPTVVPGSAWTSWWCNMNAEACDAGSCYTCGKRIDYVEMVMGRTRSEARAVVADEFPMVCGACRDDGGATVQTPPPTPVPTPAPTPPPTPAPSTPPPPSPPAVDCGDGGVGMTLLRLDGGLPAGDVSYEVRGEVSLRGAVVTVPRGTRLRIHGTGTVTVGCFVVEGTLEVYGCRGGELALAAEGGVCPGEGNGGILVREGGSLDMWGHGPGTPWTTLTRPAAGGSARLDVAADDVGDWTGEVAVASSDFDPKFHEVVRVVGAQGRTLSVEGLRYYHHGADEGASGANVEHAEVASLTRSVVVRYGFVKAVGAGAVRVRGVRFERKGAGSQESAAIVLERVQGAVVEGNAVVRSEHRCLWMREVSGAVVRGNVAYACRGHCFHSMGGLVRGNRFEGNLMIAVGRNPAYTMEAEHVAGILITNPDNEWVGNVVAGSDRYGVVLNVGWCDGVETHVVPLREFRGNRFHSMPYGLYAEPAMHVRYDAACSITVHSHTEVVDLVLWKISEQGGTKRGKGAYVYGGVVSDCARGWENLQGGTIPERNVHQAGLFQGTVFVGRSENRGNVGEPSDVQKTREVLGEVRVVSNMASRTGLRSAGFILYDGPTVFERCAFANYDGDKFCFGAPRFAAGAFQIAASHEVLEGAIVDLKDGRVSRAGGRDVSSLLCRGRAAYEWDDQFTVVLKVAPEVYLLPYEPVYATRGCAKAPSCQKGGPGGPEGGCVYACRGKAANLRIMTATAQLGGLRVCSTQGCHSFVGIGAGGTVFHLPVMTGTTYQVHLQGGSADVLLAYADRGTSVTVDFVGVDCRGRVALLEGTAMLRRPDARLVQVTGACRVTVAQHAARETYPSWCPPAGCTHVRVGVSSPDGLPPISTAFFSPSRPDPTPREMWGTDPCHSNPCGSAVCLRVKDHYRCLQ